MKRTYIQPSVATVKVNLESMIAASETMTMGGSYKGGEIQSKERGSRTAEDFDEIW